MILALGSQHRLVINYSACVRVDKVGLSLTQTRFRWLCHCFLHPRMRTTVLVPIGTHSR